MEGVRAKPQPGNRAPAATGRPIKLYPNAQKRFCLILEKVQLLICRASATCVAPASFGQVHRNDLLKQLCAAPSDDGQV